MDFLEIISQTSANIVTPRALLAYITKCMDA